MFNRLEAQQARPPDTGLVASAAATVDDGRWQSGMAWRPETAATYQLVPWCEDRPDAYPADPPGGDAVYVMPVAMVVRDECTTLSTQMDTDRVRRQAEAITSFVVARELWDGAGTRADPHEHDGDTLVNPYLASQSATVITGGPYEPKEGLRRLEARAKEAAKGQRVFIHIPLQSVFPDSVRRQGNLLLTNHDSVVVADAGYPGTGRLSAGTAEVQTVAITGAPTGGTFTLTYSGQTTAPIPYNATAAEVRAALEALSNLMVGDVTTSGGPLPGTAVTVTFAANLGNVAQMTAIGSFTGGTSPAVTVSTTTQGVAPAAEAGTWAYATGPVEVRLTPVRVNDTPAETTDRSINRRVLWAERVFAATFDPGVHFAIQLSA